MRITGGQARGITLKAPKGEGTRPATDRMREAVFSSLGPSIIGCRVADLFAGTGAYGLEALSRGAARATFYETNRQALECLRQNIRSVLRSCNLHTNNTNVVARDVYSLAPEAERFDLIFIDPPYDEIEANLQRIFDKAVGPVADKGARAILELPGNLEPEVDGWTLIRRIGKAGRDKPTAAIFKRDCDVLP